ncbi:Signal recognition particle associated protein [Candidatus Syntrophocurvum alkaliphilum]|uniref:UPF0122 protein SYNTR_1372 n=1 Tax=Candidatus Syntrophocurvum alkaliphilum TaxID=2293317 RepID=A0A6I6DBD3_9FIRM|nr:putative DNA-binding protein [Candidatus Syntrophocurvum alkaliphilum]QGT99965.1 Signal recognition particle associated protein [Candidatus Syntrophocurvum alkaliphilum]
MLEKWNYITLLKDFYGPLLTEKQQYIMSLYYENDLSLTEIADDTNSTRQAVYDILRRAENALEDYETKLGLVKKFEFTRGYIDEAYELLNNDNINEHSVKKAIEVLRRAVELI